MGAKNRALNTASPNKMEAQRGPDIPCFLKIEKWIITKIRVSSGKTNV